MRYDFLLVYSWQKEATKLEMTGQEDKAVHLLTEAYEKAKNKGKSHEAYELEMLLVEMLIYNVSFSLISICYYFTVIILLFLTS